MADFVKANDDEFLDQVGLFHTFINVDPTKYGFTQDEADALNADKTLFGTSLGDFNTKHGGAGGAAKKDETAIRAKTVFAGWRGSLISVRGRNSTASLPECRRVTIL